MFLAILRLAPSFAVYSMFHASTRSCARLEPMDFMALENLSSCAKEANEPAMIDSAGTITSIIFVKNFTTPSFTIPKF